MTRAEHLDWCKQRALAHLPENPSEALVSMLDGLSEHPETKDHPNIQDVAALVLADGLSTAHEVEEFIKDFN